MLKLSCSRRNFVGSTSLLALSAAVPTFLRQSSGQPPNLLMSAERAPPFQLPSGAVVLGGPRIARLQAMAKSLSRSSGQIVLRLDGTDDSLLDVAAQQAGVSIRRGNALPNGLGILAHVTPLSRNFA